MKFGRMDRKIRLQKYTAARDDYGQKTPVLENLDAADATLGHVWADVVHAGSPKESEKAFQMFPDRQVTFNIRHPRSSFVITEEMKIIYDGQTFQIIGIQEIGRRDGLRLICKLAKD